MHSSGKGAKEAAGTGLLSNVAAGGAAGLTGPDEQPAVAARAGLRSLVELHRAGQPRIRCVNCQGALAALAIAHLCETLPQAARPLVVVVADEAEARTLRKDLQFFLGRGVAGEGDPLAGEPVLGLPDLDISPWADASPERATVLKRMGTLFRLSQRDLLSGQVIVASVRALARRVVPKKAFAELVDVIQAEEELDRDQTIKRLTRSGYSRAPVCEDPGTFAVRGGVLDVFVPLYRFPVRIEFFGDLVESLRFYDPATQRTLRKTSEIYLHPVRETILTPGHRLRERLLDAGDLAVHPSARTRQFLEQIESGEDFFGIESLTPAFHHHMAPLAEYLPPATTFFLIEPHRLYDALRDTLIDAESQYQRRLGENRLAFPPSEFFLSAPELEKMFTGTGEPGARPTCIVSDPLIIAGDEASPADAAMPEIRFAVADHRPLAAQMQRARVEKAEHLLMPMVRVLRDNLSEGVRSVVVSSSLQHAERMEGLLKGYGLKPILHRPGVASLAAEQAHGEGLHRFDLLEQSAQQLGRLELRIGPLLRGVDLPLDRVALFSEAEIFGEKAARKASRAPKKPSLGDLKNLEVGAFVVHQLHGVGRYKGLTKLPIRTGGVSVDFMYIEYDGGTLYLPVWRLGEVQRYVGAEGITPRLDRLGGETWAKTRAKVSREVKKVAEELLQLYAQRQALPGYAFHLDSDGEQLFQEFEATFPFEETPDQERAISDVLGDMETDRPMDRLVCGDVGYGKTEVAMRAAIKAVLGKKQVAVLAPTTVLVEQHFATFSERCKDLPINITSLSRFRSRGEQTQALKRLADGGVDIVIGTHRLLSSDVRFKDLGLIIIDEEQRFGSRP